MNPTLLRLQVLDNGWHPLPVDGKKPVFDGWTQYCGTAPTVEEIEAWEQHRHAQSTGIALGRQVAIDVDVFSDPALAQQLRAEAVACFGSTPFVRIGQAPKFALIYRAAEPIVTKRFKAASGNGDGLDVLGDGTQFVAFGIHPETGRLYQWVGEASPLDAAPDDAVPAITEAQIGAFLDRVHHWMPLGGASTAGGKRPTGTGQQSIIRNAAGLVVDGREAFLMTCIWKAAGHIHAAGEPLTAEAVAARGWTYFTDRSTGADLGDRKWTERHALHKARGTVRRIASGAANLHRRDQSSPAPTYPDASRPVDEARAAVAAAIRQHLEAADAWHAAGDDAAEPPVRAIRVDTGVGKTREAARQIAERRKTNGKGRPFLYAVPTHRLGDEIEADFRRHGITARVFRGRAAPDPDRPGSTMCDDLEAVQIALDLGATVETACCKSKDEATRIIRQCPFYGACGYQTQKAVRPDVWIVAHQLLFQPQAAIGKVAGVFIDESFWQAGLWTSPRGLTLDEIEADIPLGGKQQDDAIADLQPLHRKLARALRRQDGTGGVERRHLTDEGLTDEQCTQAIALEWDLKERPPVWPGMPAAERRKAARAAKGAKHILAYDRTWRGARELLRQAEDEAVSGRLYLTDSETDHGRTRTVRTQGVRAIAAQWRSPTFIMDATLPGLEILRVFFPSVEIAADIAATMPHVEVRQVLGAPVSANKLIRSETDANRNLKAIRRAILHRYLELGRAPTLVIAQKAVAEWLRASGLPAGVAVEWFNNVAGLDRYKGVRLLISIGRTLPDVMTVEGMAGALTGLEPAKTAQPAKGPRWFDRITRGVRLKGGGGVAVQSDRHPDATAEAVRWQVCEGELLQAIGRARGVNRTGAEPLSIDIMADVVLPVTVGRVVQWDDVPAGAEVEMLAEGVWLESPADMATCWPAVWETEAAAKQWRDRLTRSQSPIDTIPYRTLGPCGRYQCPGARQKWRTARFDLSLIPDPQAWLEERLGELAGFELIPAHLDVLDRLFDAAPASAAPREPSRFACDAGAPAGRCDHRTPTFCNRMEVLYG